MKKVCLNKDEIKSMIQAKSVTEPHLVQIYSINSSDDDRKPRLSMRISDGYYYARVLTFYIQELKEYDIIRITKFKTSNLKGNFVIVLEKYIRVYTNLEKLIGAPVLYMKDNPNKEAINTEIPDNAKLLVDIPMVETKSVQPIRIMPKTNPGKQSVGSMRGIKPIKALGLASNDWTIKVRLVRKGELKRFKRDKIGESYLLPLEFIDDEGTQIAATLFATGVDKYQSILEPMKCYLVSNGTVRMANKKFTSIKNSYSLTLDGLSTIEEVPDDSGISHSCYNFTSISKISTLPNGTMIDVIGVAQFVGEVTQYTKQDGTQTVRRILRLCDDSDHEIEITIWGSLGENKYEVHEILAFKSVRVNDYNGKQLNTSWDTTITKDPDDPKTEILKDWLLKHDDTTEIVSLTTKLAFSGDLNLIAEIIKTGETLDSNSKGLFCWVNASIISIIHSKGFYYMGCKVCKKKIMNSFCENCKGNKGEKPYYMLNIKISDGTDSIFVQVFGDLGETILGVNASDLQKLEQDNRESDLREAFDKPKSNVIHRLSLGLYYAFEG